jgi:hypothetical protein
MREDKRLPFVDLVCWMFSPVLKLSFGEKDKGEARGIRLRGNTTDQLREAGESASIIGN